MRMSLSLHPEKRSRKTPKMPRPKLVDFTAKIVSANSLEEVVDILRRKAKHIAAVPPSVDSRTGKLVQWANWRNTLQRLANGLNPNSRTGTRAVAPVIILDGNVKLPFACFSSLPVFTCPGAGDCATWCYSLTSWRHAAPWARQVQNTLLLRFAPQLIEKAFMSLPSGIVFRLYVDGDFSNESDVAFWMQLLSQRPDIKAYGYSKSWDLLWEYAQRHRVPENYRLNLSSGGSSQRVSRESMLALPWVRGNFLSLPVEYRPPGVTGNPGFKRYDDPEYHRAVRRTASALGLKVFSCPGKCGGCALGKHACGSDLFRGVNIAIGIH